MNAPIRHDRGENRKGGKEAAPIFGREMKVEGNMVTHNLLYVGSFRPLYTERACILKKELTRHVCNIKIMYNLK